MLSTDAKGNIAEYEVALAAIRLGIEVYRPAGEGTRADLILAPGGHLWRVQCKWAPLRNGAVTVACQSNRRAPEGFRRRPYTADQIDAFGAYCPQLDRCYLVPIDRIPGQKSVQLRVDEPKNGQRGAIVWAREFDFSTLDWDRLGAVAQLEERRHGMAEVRGSSPLSSTQAPSPTIVGSHEFRNLFGYYLDRVDAGEEFVVTRRGRPRMRISPAPGG